MPDAGTLPEHVRNVRDRVNGYIHATDADAPDRWSDLIDLIDCDQAYVAVTGALSIIIGTASKLLHSPHPDAVVGAHPMVHAFGAPTVTLNQATAAAANRDYPTMEAVLITLAESGDSSARRQVLVSLGIHAIALHRQTCATAHA